nr:immunoglobulin light chain junction region [Macaca mulatta]
YYYCYSTDSSGNHLF